MRSFSKFYPLTVFLSLTFLLFSTITSAKAQAKPTIYIVPNPVQDNKPATFYASGCTANSTATFNWQYNNVVTQNVQVKSGGTASYTHDQGFSSHNDRPYEAWVTCGGQTSNKLSFWSVKSCSTVDSLSITATSPAPYIQNKTKFIVRGSVPYCEQKASESRFYVLFVNRKTNDSFSHNPVTDSAGNFTINDVLFPDSGTWDLGITDGARALSGNNSATIVIEKGGSEAKTIACGETFISTGLEKCEDGCIAQTIDRQTNKMKCESKEDTDTRQGCLSPEIIKELDNPPCDTEKELTEPVACENSGEEGKSCPSTSLMCIDNENIMCQTNDEKPPPPPPAPQCLEFNPPLGVGDDSTPRTCVKVKSAFGELLTTPEGFITKLFGLLLSLSGGIALLLIIRSGYQLMVSHGDPEQIKEARERLTSAIVGLLFLIFSLVILQIIGVDILHIPGLKP